MNYFENRGFTTNGMLYSISREQLNKLVRDFVFERTGARLQLEINDDTFDMWVAWNAEDAEKFKATASYEQRLAVSAFGIQSQDNKKNRDAIFQQMFKTKYIDYRIDASVLNEMENHYEFIVKDNTAATYIDRGDEEALVINGNEHAIGHLSTKEVIEILKRETALKINMISHDEAVVKS
ncbi:hypothetical protein CN918_29555 [Priestia megaterium]|nr:hypothetical protein CN918_29555 [Priestia megaterium]